MLIDMDVTIAYKCSSCGTFEFTNISLFKFCLQGNLRAKCRCKGTKLEIAKLGNKEYSITVPCISCGREHSHIIGREELISKKILILSCPITNTSQCFVGADELVRKKVDIFERELDEMLDKLGFDNYFENTRVMLDTLNIIHEIAEKGQLHCKCGCRDIIVSLLPGEVFLKCRKCSRSKLIPAASNSDLKKTLQKSDIYLAEKQAQKLSIKK